ncbi:Transcriptional regulatory protein zraR [Acidisarcina polymorpha]|uniref:Transcriptional regulatory protein zraR n=1 Tax=Acidisarcina polymorpha TaxID=2211140 RepID=A0A2Z5G5P5_9BACT|nr:response regulator [Acidisarcina polymorpha]AXC14553.1 Transcriptional regulatory protein zraR [Acidisarcina polymorpha]
MEHRITIVDDEGEVRSALRRLLKVAGMKTQTYASAEDFLDAASGRHCDCLILDHGLPGMSGLELQSRLAARGRRVPIIFISARDDAYTRAQAMQAGALAFLGKPFSDEVLLQAVQAALQLAGS